MIQWAGFVAWPTVPAIGAARRAAGAASPTESELMRLTVAGVSGRNRRAAVQAPALLDDGVEAILATARLPRERARRGMESAGAGSPAWRGGHRPGAAGLRPAPGGSRGPDLV